MAGGYIGSAWGMPMVEVDPDDAAALWGQFPEDLREVDDDGVITLWARAEDGRRFAPICLRPYDEAAAA